MARHAAATWCLAWRGAVWTVNSVDVRFFESLFRWVSTIMARFGAAWLASALQGWVWHSKARLAVVCSGMARPGKVVHGGVRRGLISGLLIL